MNGCEETCGQNGWKKGLSKGTTLTSWADKKKQQKTERLKEVLECEMIARGLQKLYAQVRESLQLGCKTAWSLYAENICWASKIEGSTFLEQNDEDE